MGKRRKQYYAVKVGDHTFSVPRRYKNLRLLASGTGGVVCSATDVIADEKVAIKKLTGALEHENIALCTYREIMLMKAVNHKNVIKLLKAYTPQRTVKTFEDIYFVMEFREFDLTKINGRTLSLECKSVILYKILCGVKHLHCGNIIHRDLKPENVVSSKDLSVVVVDLGLARTTPVGFLDQNFQMSSEVVTLNYRAPELCLELDYGSKIDIWAIGCIMAELITGEQMFTGQDQNELLKNIVEILGTPEEDYVSQMEPKAREFLQSLPHQPGKSFESLFPDSMMHSDCNRVNFQPSSARDLLSKMLEFDPAKRISVHGALNHPFIRLQWRLVDVYAAPPTPDPYDTSLEMTDMTLEEWKAVIFQQLRPGKA